MPGTDKRGTPGRRGLTPSVVVMALAAAAIGYFAASRLDWFFADRSGVTRRFTVMNTEAAIIVPATSGQGPTPSELADLAERAVREVDRLMSPVGDGSDIKRLNSAPAGRWVAVSPETWTVVMEALRWHRLSEGAFDPTIGALKKLFRFDGRDVDSWPDPDSLAEARRLVGAGRLLFEREGMRLSWDQDGMGLDLGAVAKGYGVDRAVEVLRANGARNALVEIGGEVRTLGVKPGSPERPWRTGIQNPRGDGYIPVDDVGNKAFATSGDYSQFFHYQGRRYTHIIDPRDGAPLVEGVAGVSVIHPESCMMADALATTLVVLGKDGARRFLEKHALSLFSTGLDVVMFTVQPDGGLLRTDFAIDTDGKLTVSEKPAEFIVNGDKNGGERPRESE